MVARAKTNTGPDASTVERYRSLVRSSGGRITQARLSVMEVLRQSGEHLTAREIHARVITETPAVNMSTVYRTLNRLEALGLVHTLATPGEARFGIADTDHHHSICTGCGSVQEIDPRSLAALLPALQEITGLATDPTAGVTVRGRCPRCRRAASS